VAKTGHPNFVYEMQSPWRVGEHNWSLTGNHSGSSFDATDAETFMTGSASPFALTFRHFIATPGTTVVRAAYYDGETSAPIWEALYDVDSPAVTPLVPLGDAMAEIDDPGPLEVCVILEAPAGLSSRSKPVYLRKYIHSISGGNTTSSDTGIAWTFDAGSIHTNAVAAMGNGDWFGTRVYISPTGRQPASGAWVALPSPGNHQMPRGRKKPASSTGSSILSALESAAGDIAAAAKLL
jgi:hypothetical protein